MKIAYLYLCYRISGNLHQDVKYILMYDHRKHLSKEIPFETDDLLDLEMYKIMRMPVVPLPVQKTYQIRKQADLRLENPLLLPF